MNADRDWLVVTDATNRDPSVLGGKGAKLFELCNGDTQVPAFFVVTSHACEEVLQSNAKLAPLFDRLSRLGPDDPSVSSVAEEIRGAIGEAELPGELENQLSDALDGLTEGCVAVRSSAVDEDAADLSFAGLHDSFLYQRGFEQVRDSVRRVWASAYNERALAYRLKHAGQAALGLVPMAVVVQRMVDARTSGVAFTCEPATYDTSKVVVSSLWGAGEGLVSAGLDADTFVFDKQSGSIESSLTTKPEQLIADAERGGLRREATPVDRADAPSLSEAEIRAVANLAIAIERRYRCPQDIEFSFDEAGELLLLQARPVAGVPEYGPAAGHPLLWDNSNIIESYSGVTSPMTFSFIRRAYTIVYHCFSEVMGISPETVRANRGTFENMLGLIHGRVYYNFKNWHRLIRLFPGYEYNRQAMESMMGVRESLALDDPPPDAGFWKRWFVEAPKLVRLLTRSTWNFTRIKPIVNEFQARFHLHYNRWRAMHFERLAPHELMGLYNEMEDTLLWNWKAPIINDFYVMIYFGALRKLCGSWCHDETDSLQNDLVCGEPGVESAEPARFLLRLAQRASGNAFLKQAILEQELRSLPATIASREDCHEFHADMQQYLDLYGFRCMNELKLEEYSLRDRPYLVYQMLRNYLALNDPDALDVERMQQREKKIRADAEQRVDEALAGKPIKRWLVDRVLRRARLGVKNRENMRFARTRIYGIVRELLRSMGNRLAEAGVISDREDIFYLTLDEVWDYVKGTAVCTRLDELATLRRREFDAYRQEADPPDERFLTHGMVYHRNLFRDTRPADDIGASEMKGIGVCAGEVIGEAKVIHSPSDDVTLSREILVAERTDPGWVPLYPAVSGILIERGSVLSHSAVVAREMGIPTIVGVRGLLQRVNSGDRLRMDGRSGVVEVLNEPELSVTED